MDAVAFCRRHLVVTLTPSPGRPSVVETVAGGPIRGSWWAHPKGRAIFAFAAALADSPEVLVTRLVGGRVTFVHRALWPSLLRVVLDPAWRARNVGSLAPLARRLLETVERRGEARLDRLAAEWRFASDPKRRALSAAGLVLERAMLVQGRDVHTEKGRHATALRSWRRWARERRVRRTGSFEVAENRLRRACGRSGRVGLASGAH